MATIATTTNTAPVIYPATTLLDRSPPYLAAIDGHLYSMVKSGTANTYSVYRSIDKGLSWGLYASFTRTAVVELGPIVVTGDLFLYHCYRVNESNMDRVFVRRLNLVNATWDTFEALVGQSDNGGVAGAALQGVDMQLSQLSGVVRIVVAGGFTSGSQHGVYTFTVLYDSNNSTASTAATVVTGTRFWTFPGSGRIGPGVDIEHNGDAHNGTTPHLWIAYGRTSLRVVKLTWNGAGWNGPSTAQTLVSTIPAQDYLTGRWDGNRFVVATKSTDRVVLYERNRANSSTTIRTTPAHPTGVVRNCSFSYNAVTGDLRVYAVGTSTAVLYYVDFVRATATWTSWATVVATAVLGTTGDNFGARRSSYGNARFDVYTAHTGAPNTVVHTAQTIVYTPYTPTWETPSGGQANGDARDVNFELRLNWAFTDPDVNDSQKDYALRRQVGGGGFLYWRASDNTWQAAEQKNAAATTELAIPSGWGADGDGPHSYYVKVWDQGDLASGYSTAWVAVPSVVVNPAITAPAAAAVLTEASVTVTWTATQQTAYRMVLRTNPGAATAYDSGWVSDAAARAFTIPYVLPDGTGWTIALRTKNNEGMQSAEQTRSVTVDYLEPMTPTLAATAVPASGWISVAVTNPAPSGGRPALSTQDLWRRPVGDVTDGVRVGTALVSGTTVLDWRARSGVAYEYRAQAFGVNGTTIYSAWTP